MLRTYLETRHFSLRRSEIEGLRDRLGPLSSIAREFVFANLRITISYLLPDEEYHVKGRLCVPERVLLTGEHDSIVMPPYERCLDKLVKKAEGEHERRQATRKVRQSNEVNRINSPNSLRLRRDTEDEEYRAFLEDLAGHSEQIQKRVRAWVMQRVGTEVELRDRRVLDDLVEEVMLSAFERYDSRPSAMAVGDWIEILVDPSLRSLLGRPDEPNEAVSYARSLREMRAGRPAQSNRPATAGQPASRQWSSDPRDGTPRSSRETRKQR